MRPWFVVLAPSLCALCTACGGGESGEPADKATGQAVAVQMHLHGPISEGDTTYAFQHSEAVRHGVGVLWWTDHDHMYDRSDWLRSPTWMSGEPLSTAAPGGEGEASWWVLSAHGVGVSAEVVTAAGSDPVALAVTADSSAQGAAPAALGLAGCSGADGWARATWMARADRGYNLLARPLLGGLVVRLALRPDISWESGVDRVRVRLPLSVVDVGRQRVVWLAESDDTWSMAPGETRIDIELEPDTWTTVEVDLSAFAESELPEALDLALQGLELHVSPGKSGDATVQLAQVTIEESVCCEELIGKQRTLLDALSDDRVLHLAGLELSYDAARHLTSFGSMPFLDYELFDLDHPKDIVDFAHEHGAKVAMTHVFGSGADEIAAFMDADERVSQICEELIESGVYGADFIEVGYLQRTLALDSHLAVWDCVLGAGFTPTGIGTSDNHLTRPWEHQVNPFVTWVMAEAEEGAILEALGARRAFFGDPIRVEAPWFDLHVDGGGAMGDVLDVEGPVRIEAEISGVDAGYRLHWVVDGERVATDQPSIEVTPGAWTYVRAEVYSPAGRGLLFSNPVFLRDSGAKAPG